MSGEMKGLKSFPHHTNERKSGHKCSFPTVRNGSEKFQRWLQLAYPRASALIRGQFSLIPQRFYRIQPRSFPCWPQAKTESQPN